MAIDGLRESRDRGPGDERLRREQADHDAEASRRDNPLFPAAAGRAVAEQIPDARFVEVPGADYGLAVGDVDAVIDEVEEFVTGSRPTHDADRVLATVLFTDIVGSTTRAAELGDRRWRELLDLHEEIATREVAARGGLVASFTGDGLVARFDGPARAVRCALALREQLRGLGIQVRAGLHTGEIEVRGDAVAGIAVHIAARVMALAGTDEVLVSRTVRDLVAGSGLRSTIAARMCSRASPSPGRWSSRRAERAAGARRVVL